MPSSPLTPATQRLRELQRLLPLWPAEIGDVSPAGRKRLIATLERALRAERRRGLSGHWSYDLGRHAALLRAWRREIAELASSVHAKGAQTLRSAPRVLVSSARGR